MDLTQEAHGRWRPFWIALGAASVAFHVWLIFSGLVPHLISRPVHFALAAPWALVFFAKGPVARWSGVALTVVALAICAYIALNEDALGDQFGRLRGPFQLAMAVALILIVLEMARRTVGWPLPFVALLTLLYGLLGQYVPGRFGYNGIPIESFLGTMTIATGGVWGRLAGVSVDIVAVFVILGAVLNAGEAGRGFMNLAAAAAGRLTGGAAKISVISSALFGSISGSASANVASTGAITLPTMRRLGYPKPLAAAVEAVASSGGQIMPPLMGAGAFVMVELVGVSYETVMAAALLPAVLYFVAVWAGVDAFATRHDLRPLPAEQRPRARETLITAAFAAVPFAVLLERMFVGDVTPAFAAASAILAAFVLLPFDGALSFSGRRFVSRSADALLAVGRQIAVIASIIFCAGLIIGVLNQTGLGVKITSLILSASGGRLWAALLLTGLACLLLGMEAPTTAAYVICVSIAGPALQQLGLSALEAHLFVFWFALLSTITPPVCGAVFIAAGMVGENWLAVAVRAMALGVGLYLVPLAMVASPDLIRLAEAPLAALFAALHIGLGLAAGSFALIATGSPARRIALAVLSVALMFGPPALRMVFGG